MNEEKSLMPINAGIQQLFREIRQINEQYKREVPKKRRPWPSSIQARILELWKLGISTHQISAETGMPCQTMYSWRQRLKKSDPGFLPVRIVNRRRHKSAQQVQLLQLENRPAIHTPTVTVVLPGGVRIEGLGPEQAIMAAARLSQ